MSKVKTIIDVMEDRCDDHDHWWWFEARMEELGLDKIPADAVERIARLENMRRVIEGTMSVCETCESKCLPTCFSYATKMERERDDVTKRSKRLESALHVIVYHDEDGGVCPAAAKSLGMPQSVSGGYDAAGVALWALGLEE